MSNQPRPECAPSAEAGTPTNPLLDKLNASLLERATKDVDCTLTYEQQNDTIDHVLRLTGQLVGSKANGSVRRRLSEAFDHIRRDVIEMRHEVLVEDTISRMTGEAA